MQNSVRDRSRQALSPPSPYKPRPTAPCCLATRAQPKLKGGVERLPYGKQLIKLGHFILGKRRQKSATWYGTEKGKQGIAAQSLLKSDGGNSKLNRQKGALLQTKGGAASCHTIHLLQQGAFQLVGAASSRGFRKKLEIQGGKVQHEL